MITLDLDLSDEDKAFRQEVRAFLAEAFTPDLQAGSKRQAGVFSHPDIGLEWQRRLYRRGWGAPGWPKEYDGADLTPMQRYILSMECAQAGTPVYAGMGLLMCGPVLMKFGTDEQKARFLPRILSGDDYWCQGFSEPGAGSDLSALRCAADRVGDDYIVNGSKIWTTHAHHANWIFLLVRTSTEGPRQAGITFLLAPMDSPGITVRPILSMSGEHEVNEVFFDNVRIPVSNRVGDENAGWDVAKYLLVNERGGGSAAATLAFALGRTRAVIAGETDDEGQPLSDDRHFQDQLAMLEISIAAIAATEWRNISLGASAQGGDRKASGAAASMQKLKVSSTIQKLAELAVEALGPQSAIDHRALLYSADDSEVARITLRETVVARHLNVRAATIFGGASEIQKAIIARLALGL